MRDPGPAKLSADDPWSKEDVQDLRELLLRDDGLSIVEMAAILKRDYRDVRDKVAEIGRSCRTAIVSPT